MRDENTDSWDIVTENHTQNERKPNEIEVIYETGGKSKEAPFTHKPKIKEWQDPYTDYQDDCESGAGKNL